MSVCIYIFMCVFTYVCTYFICMYVSMHARNPKLSQSLTLPEFCCTTAVKHKFQLKLPVSFLSCIIQHSSTPDPVTYTSQHLILPRAYCHKERKSGYRQGNFATVYFVSHVIIRYRFILCKYFAICKIHKVFIYLAASRQFCAAVRDTKRRQLSNYYLQPCLLTINCLSLSSLIPLLLRFLVLIFEGMIINYLNTSSRN